MGSSFSLAKTGHIYSRKSTVVHYNLNTRSAVQLNIHIVSAFQLSVIMYITENGVRYKWGKNLLSL